MIKIKRIIAIAVILILTLGLFSGCGAQQGSSSNNNQTKASEESNGKSIYPLKVKDSTGYEMTIEKKPEAIVSMTLGTDEMLLSLTDKSKIKALSGKIAEDEGISNVADKAKDFTKAEQNIETIISLKPDIVFAANWMKKEDVQQLRDAKIPVYCYATATNIEEQKKVIMEIAHVIGEDSRGQQIVNDMDTRLNAVEDKIKSLKPEEKLTVMDYDDSYGYTYGKGSTFDDISAKAGLINIASKEGLQASERISKEKIVQMNPDVIILPSWSYDKKQDPVKLAEEFKNDKSLAHVKAIKNNRVYLLPDKHLTCVSQYIILGVEDLAKAVYPQLFISAKESK
jgi:iron complex transport system substrate-binding protein